MKDCALRPDHTGMRPETLLPHPPSAWCVQLEWIKKRFSRCTADQFSLLQCKHRGKSWPLVSSLTLLSERFDQLPQDLRKGFLPFQAEGIK